MTSTPQLAGFGVGRFRGIGHAPVRLGHFAKMNFFIGQNNSGKSSILLAMHKMLRLRGANLHRFDDVNLDQWDRHNGGDEQPFIEIAVPIDRLIHSIPKDILYREIILNIASDLDRQGLVWLRGDVGSDNFLSFADRDVDRVKDFLADHVASRISSTLSGTSGGYQENVERIFRWLLGCL